MNDGEEGPRRREGFGQGLSRENTEMLSPRRSSLYCLCACIANSLLEPSNTENILSSPPTASSVRAVSDLCRGRTNPLVKKFFSLLAVKRLVHGRCGEWDSFQKTDY